MISQLVRASVIVLLCATTAAQAASPRKPQAGAPGRNPYDGAWTVMIVTERGSCDRAYRYGLQIVDGVVQYDGAVSFTGNVTPKGAVRVSVSAAGNRAEGSGRMTRNTGQGKWVGYSGSDSCSGYWQAERR